MSLDEDDFPRLGPSRDSAETVGDHALGALDAQTWKGRPIIGNGIVRLPCVSGNVPFAVDEAGDEGDGTGGGGEHVGPFGCRDRTMPESLLDFCRRNWDEKVFHRQHRSQDGVPVEVWGM